MSASTMSILSKQQRLMYVKRIFAQAVKELKQFQRDKLTVALAFALPILTFFIFGYAIRLEEKDIPITVQDYDNSPLSRAYTERLYSNDQFEPVGFRGKDPIHSAIDSQRAQAAVIIPPEFARKYKAGLASPIEVLIDGTDVNNARVIQNSIIACTRVFESTFKFGPQYQPIQPETRLWFNPGRKESLYVVPGLFAVILLIYPALLSSLAMVKEKEQGTILQMYASSITSVELVLGKALAYLLIGIAEALLIFAFAFVLFDINFASDPTPMVIGTILYIFDSVMYGLLLGAVSKTQSAAVQNVAFSGFTPALLLSGFLYPTRNIKFPFNYISLLVPARYYVSLCRDSLVRGSGWAGEWYMLIILIVTAVLLFRVCNKKMSRMQIEA